MFGECCGVCLPLGALDARYQTKGSEKLSVKKSNTRLPYLNSLLPNWFASLHCCVLKHTLGNVGATKEYRIFVTYQRPETSSPLIWERVREQVGFC